MKMRTFSICLLLTWFLWPAYTCASNSDSLDVVHYRIHLDTLINTGPVKRIYAHTDVTLVPTISGLNRVTLDLLRLNIDSIKVDGQPATYSYNDTLIAITTPVQLNPGDTAVVTVWYWGQPTRDPSFGGFYFQGSYIFNLGVGLNSNPHTYGRSWFPCKDNFQDRAYFDFHIRADQGLTAVCNGSLQSAVANLDGTKTWHWSLRDNIPTYLAGVAIAPYLIVEDYFVNLLGDTIPFQIFAVAADTTSAKAQSINLKAGVAAFENRFGPYVWERLGYVMVSLPLSGSIGAMEHATNIAYPRVLLGSGLAFENIWAHEAAHAWFGNLVTCEEEGEMWLNEGWASYCEAIFMEAIYGISSRKDFLRGMHADALRRSFAEEGGYHPLSGMPHLYTYSRTTYSRGATVAHTIRGLLGDSDFFPAVTQYLSSRRFRHVHSDSLRIDLEAYTGRNLQDFFNTWVSQPGYLHYSLDSFTVQPNGPNFDVTIVLRQRTKGATILGTDMPLPVRFLGQGFEIFDTSLVVNGPNASFNLSLGFSPVAAALDPEEKVADATTDSYKTITTIGNKTFSQTWLEVNVDSVTDSAWVQVVHNWVAPDSFLVPRQWIKLSNSRYWTVQGIFPAGFTARGTFQYNGTNSLTSGQLDNTWMTNAEDSLLLFYRPSAACDWTMLNNITRNIGSPNDRVGNIVVSQLLPGDYTLGTYDAPIGIAPEAEPLNIKVFPNPNDGRFWLELPSAYGFFEITLTDASGRVVFSREVRDEAKVPLAYTGHGAGWYLVVVRDELGRSGFQRVLIDK